MSKNNKKIYPKKRGNRFYLDKNSHPESLLFDTIPSFIKSLISRRKNRAEDVHKWFTKKEPLSCSLQPIITWLGHASFLIQIGDVNILTDPVFGDLWLFRRQLPVGITLEDLPPIDVVLISHNHHDHMDAVSLHALKKQKNDIRFLVPQGDKRWFDRQKFYGVTEHMWWEQESIIKKDSQPVLCSFLPAAHWSQRGLFDKNKSLWGSWMIEWDGYRIYFAGDTAYGHHFSGIADEFSSVDLALLPIGPCEPREWMKRTHMNSHESGKAFLDLAATHFMPMHWGTFSFGVDHFSMPIDQLRSWWTSQQQHLHAKKLHIVKAGEPVIFEMSQPSVVAQQEVQK